MQQKNIKRNDQSSLFGRLLATSWTEEQKIFRYNINQKSC